MLAERSSQFYRGLVALLWAMAVEGCVGSINGNSAGPKALRQPASAQVASARDGRVGPLQQQVIIAPLTATGISPNRVDLTWRVKLGGVISIQILRSADRTVWTPIARVPVSTSHYADTGLDSNAIYEYRLSAADFPTVRALGPEAAAVTLPEPPGPAPRVVARNFSFVSASALPV